VTVRLDTRADITLDAWRRVAWDGEAVEISRAARARMDRAHDSLEALVEATRAADPAALIYGITTGPGDAAAAPLSAEARARRPRRLWTAASFGQPLPARAVRGIVLARLANFLDGHAAVRAPVAQAVADMLARGPLPDVPAHGNGGAGEILALGHLFHGVSARLELTAKERMALINGSPCAAALTADAAVAGRGRLELAERVFALAAESMRVPLETYAAELEPLWEDEHEVAALRSLRELLAGGGEPRQGHQSPVSFRILPRLLGRARRAQAEAESAAAVSLRSVTDNPVHIPPDDAHALGAILSNGGFHNARGPAALNGLALAWADLGQLAQRQTDRLLQHEATLALLARDEWTFKPFHMVQTGWAEEARALAQPTLLSLGGFGQNDVPAPGFPAWSGAVGVGRCLDQGLAVLAALAAHAVAAAGAPPPPALGELVATVLEAFPPPDGARPLGPYATTLAAAFERRVFFGRVAAAPAA
jgi:histidine ammonia-lyase